MRHRKHVFKVGRKSEHVKSLLANQVSSLIMEESIRTTVTKAKETRRLAERMVTLGKRGTLHHRRLAISRIRNKLAVRKLFSEVAPRYMEREGGYTRIIRLGTRGGDAAEMCILEWVEAGQPAQRQSSGSPAAKEETAEESAKAAAAAAAEEESAEQDEEVVAAEEEASADEEEAAAETEADEQASAEEADEEADEDKEEKKD